MNDFGGIPEKSLCVCPCVYVSVCVQNTSVSQTPPTVLLQFY